MSVAWGKINIDSHSPAETPSTCCLRLSPGFQGDIFKGDIGKSALAVKSQTAS